VENLGDPRERRPSVTQGREDPQGPKREKTLSDPGERRPSVTQERGEPR